MRSRFLHCPEALCVLLLTLCAGGARADEGGQHVFWEVTGRHNTVYLLGSVHLLHADDNALPSVTEAAYLDAETVVEEIDLANAASEMLKPEVMAMQILPAGQSLPQLLGPELHARLATVVSELGLAPDFLARMQPWFVAVLIAELRFTKAGYSAEDGVDQQIASRAQRDGKRLRGLETVAQQLGFLAGMPMDEQREFLAATLEESADAAELREITSAWRSGDLKRLEALLRDGELESPELYQRIVVDRNRAWVPQIEAMLAEPGDHDYLVVTGAAHMVGKEGVVELLRRKGYAIKRR
jgi:uncharacterized protein